MSGPERPPLDGRTDLPHPAPGAARPAPDCLSPARLVGGPPAGRTHDAGPHGDRTDLIRIPTAEGDLVYRRVPGQEAGGRPVFRFEGLRG